MGNHKVGGELVALDVRAEVVKSVSQRLTVQLIDKSLPRAMVSAVVHDEAKCFEFLKVAEHGVVRQPKVAGDGSRGVAGWVLSKVPNDSPAHFVHTERLHGSISRLRGVIGWFGISGHHAILPQLFTSAYYTSIKCKGGLDCSTVLQVHPQTAGVSVMRGFIGPLIGGVGV